MASSKEIKKQIIREDPWAVLRSFTDARIALGSTGTSIPLKETLRFKMAHANARDAVYSTLETDDLLTSLQQFKLPIYLLHSNAKNRLDYLQRPDKGRQLNINSIIQLEPEKNNVYDIAFVIGDGLSATAINHHAIKVLKLIIPQLQQHFNVAPISIVKEARVAVADEIGATLHVKITVIFIGERPGLSASDSMGIYLTYNPLIGLTDDSRNCISNIRQGGLSYQTAADKLLYLINESMRLRLSGTALKDNTGLIS